MKPFSKEALNNQVEHLKQVERLSADQIAKHLNVSKSTVEKILKEENLCLFLFRIRIEYLGQVYQSNSVPISGWHRDIELGSDVALHNLNDFIQEVLGWDNTHLYEFTVSDNHYAYLGDDDYVVNDVFEKYYSAKISLGTLGLHKADTFIYLYDFGDRHLFSLTVMGIEKAENRTDFLRVVGLTGRDLIQYRTTSEEDEGQIFGGECTRTDFRMELLHQKTVPLSVRDDIKKVDFILAKDEKTLEHWRNSKDKQKWEIAVTILENRSMSLKEISKKIERPEKLLRKWIRIFNYFGIAGVERIMQCNLVRDKNAVMLEKVSLRTTKLMEIIHHKPNYYGINRSSWTLPSLAKVYKEQSGEKLGTTTIFTCLKAAKYTIKKARRVLTSPDPDYREKVEGLLKVLHSLGPDEMLFFIDELGPWMVKNYGGRTYVKENDVRTYPQKQNEKGTISMAGALSATTNQVTWMYIKAKDSSAMIDLVEILFNQHYKMTKLYITWDCASWHGSNALVSWLEDFNAETERSGAGPIIEFIPLPTSSQFLDVIESVFSGMKKGVIHNSDYQSETEMKTAISRYFLERNDYFKENPKRAGKKIWEIDFFRDIDAIKSGDYREW